jgi:cation diffusion facilitator family transporter
VVAPDHGQESRRTVVVALLSNLGIAVAKLAAAVVTGSTAMFAETVHSAADTGNSVLLLVAQHRSRRPAAPSGLSRGREAYFWALLAAIGVFVVGAVLAVYEGVRELVNPVPVESFVVAYVVLAVAFLLDLVSFLRARRQLRREAQAMARGLLEHVRMTSDPTTRAVFAEDAAGLTGNVLAATGIALHQVTGSVIPDAVAAIGIGLVLGAVAVLLVETSSWARSWRPPAGSASERSSPGGPGWSRSGDSTRSSRAPTNPGRRPRGHRRQPERRRGRAAGVGHRA